MIKQQFSTIDRNDLEQRMAAHSLNNQDRHRGFALVNVLGEGAFAMAHIPGSINIPHGTRRVRAALCQGQGDHRLLRLSRLPCLGEGRGGTGDSRLSKGV
jgi:hypothetical protein